MKTAINRSDLPSIEQPGKICILKSKWYPEFVESMSDHAESILRESGFSNIESHTLPGSLEIPLAARELLARDANKEIDAILCFGVIVKGDTLHFEMISQESMRGLGTVMHDFLCPIIVEILPVFYIEQARLRCSDNEENKGIEAAVAALEMIHWRRSLG